MADYHWRLLPVDATFPVKADTQAAVDRLVRPHQEFLGRVVGRTATSLNRMTFLEATTDNFITAAYLEATGAEVAVSRGWRFGPPVRPARATSRARCARTTSGT